MNNLVKVQSHDNVISIFDYSENFVPENEKKIDRDDDSEIIQRAADPIKDLETLDKIKTYILENTGKYGLRNFMIFVFGLNVGRRCGDTLKLKLRDVYDFDRNIIKDKVVHREEKTGKILGFYIPDKLKPMLLDYINSLKNNSPSDFLFRSQKGGSLGTRSYWDILKKVKLGLDLDLRLGTHSCRKTFGYFTFKTLQENGSPFALQTVRAMFGHFDEKTTSRYIGLDDDELRKGYNSILL